MDILEIGKIAIICLFAYLFGSIPFGYIVAKVKGIEIQKVGSGNIGGTNVGRILGPKYGFFVGFADAWKATVSVAIASLFLPTSGIGVGLALFCCLLGAVFSIWLKLWTGSFKAGKGVGALIGGLLVLAGWKWVIIIGCGIIAFFFLARRKMSAASLILVASILLLAPLVPALINIMPITLLIVALIWWAHRENIKRLVENIEPSLALKLPSFFRKIPEDGFWFVIDKIKFLKKKR